MMKRQIQIIAGIAIWVAAICYAGFLSTNQSDVRVREVRREIVSQVTGQRQRIFIQMERPVEVGIGDPIFVLDYKQGYRQVGEVANIPARVPLRFGVSDHVTTGEVILYGDAPALSEDCLLRLYHTPESMEWVVQTMLPPEKREQIAEEISAAFEENHREIVEMLQPIVEEGFQEAIAVVEVDLEAALLRRSGRLESIGAKYQTDLIEREIVPLVKTEVFPIVRRYGEPIANDVGREMWDRASLWRFGWRYMYDVSPLPQRDLAKKEFDRFVNDDAIPVLEEYVDEFVWMQQKVFSDLSRNEKVKDVIRRSLQEIVRDSEVQQVVMEIVREVFIDNPRLKQVLQKHWNSPEARRTFRIASQRLEPTVVRIGEMLLGTPETGITPEFARVLRNQVMRKDRRWLVLETGAEQESAKKVADDFLLRVKPAASGAENPFFVAPKEWQ